MSRSTMPIFKGHNRRGGKGMKNNVKLNESVELDLYKRLLTVFGDYVEVFAGTGYAGMLDKFIAGGVRVIPKDKKAREVLGSVLWTAKSIPAIVNDVVNMRLSDVVRDVRPRYREGHKIYIAMWSADVS